MKRIILILLLALGSYILDARITALNSCNVTSQRVVIYHMPSGLYFRRSQGPADVKSYAKQDSLSYITIIEDKLILNDLDSLLVNNRFLSSVLNGKKLKRTRNNPDLRSVIVINNKTADLEFMYSENQLILQYQDCYYKSKFDLKSWLLHRVEI
jgi:hypothetical protein